MTLNSAVENKVICAIIPINEYLQKDPKSRGNYSTILTPNQVFDILLSHFNTQDWPTALKAGVPKRRGYV